MRRIEKVKFVFSWLMRILLLVAIVIAIVKADWINLALASITLFFTFLPSIIEREIKIDYPSEFEILILFFLFASLYFGEIQSFYVIFWWWDLFLHFLSGIIIGIIGFSLVRLLHAEKTVHLEMSPVFTVIFSFCFAVTIGVLWEVFEFLMDSVFGLNMMKSGLVDTMWDIIVDACGALIISTVGYFYIKKENFKYSRIVKFK
ncbi:MAG: hypothetical protein GF349_03630 [Candidatus Magasanikbacteria bacterium]|nr:hypothetical protein [Candidatus Magasanikbacteria bacterium]